MLLLDKIEILLLTLIEELHRESNDELQDLTLEESIAFLTRECYSNNSRDEIKWDEDDKTVKGDLVGK